MLCMMTAEVYLSLSWVSVSQVLSQRHVDWQRSGIGAGAVKWCSGITAVSMPTTRYFPAQHVQACAL